MQTETCSSLLSLPGRALPHPPLCQRCLCNCTSSWSRELVQLKTSHLEQRSCSARPAPHGGARRGRTRINANTWQPGPGPAREARELHPCPPAWEGRIVFNLTACSLNYPSKKWKSALKEKDCIKRDARGSSEEQNETVNGCRNTACLIPPRLAARGGRKLKQPPGSTRPPGMKRKE